MVSFTDLNDDILHHIASLASLPAPTLKAHWHNTTTPPKQLARDVHALHATCRRTHAALRPPLVVTIRDDVDAGARLARWAEAPDEVLGRVRRVRLLPSRLPDRPLPPSVAQTHFELFACLLARSPRLEAVEVGHNLFCTHDAYGLGAERRFVLLDPIGDIDLARVAAVSVSLRCRVCAVQMARVLASWCPRLVALKCSAVTPHAPELVLAPLLVLGCMGALRVLHLKIGDEWDLATLLHVLSPLAQLEQLYVATYDASRKVQVVLAGDRVLPALTAFPHLRALDLCLAPSIVAPHLASIVGEEDVDAPRWHDDVRDAAERISDTCPSLQQGWWWTQVVDLDYHQLKGYERWAWHVDAGTGEIVLDDEPARLAPMVVRNQDGQGTTREIPSEEWN